MTAISSDLIAMLVPEALSLVKAGVQGVQAQQLKKEYQRPHYDIPQSYREQINVLAQAAANPEIPGYDEIVKQIKDNLGDTLFKSMEYGDPSKAVFSAGMGTESVNNLLAKLGVSGAQYNNQNQLAYANALKGFGELEDTKFKINELDPYEAAKAAESALREGAFKNLEYGLKGASAAYLTDKYLIDPNMVGSGTGATPSGFSKPKTIPGFTGPVSTAPGVSQTKTPDFEFDDSWMSDVLKF